MSARALHLKQSQGAVTWIGPHVVERHSRVLVQLRRVLSEQRAICAGDVDNLLTLFHCGGCSLLFIYLYISKYYQTDGHWEPRSAARAKHVVHERRSGYKQRHV